MPAETFSTPKVHAKAHNISLRTQDRWRATGIGPPYIKVGAKILYWSVGSELHNEWARKRTVCSIAEAEAIS